MTSGYKIDGYDLQDVYNIHVLRITGLLDGLKRKGEISQSWPDSDGEDAFTTSTDIHFEARDIMLHGLIEASTRTIFVAKLNSFKQILQSPGTRILQVPYLSRSFNVFYYDSFALDMLTKWTAGRCAGTFFVKFREPNPSRSIL